MESMSLKSSTLNMPQKKASFSQGGNSDQEPEADIPSEMVHDEPIKITKNLFKEPRYKFMSAVNIKS